MPQSKSFRLRTDLDTYEYRAGRWTIVSTGERVTDKKVVRGLEEFRAMTDDSFLDLRDPPLSAKTSSQPSKRKASPSKPKSSRTSTTRSTGGKNARPTRGA